MYSCWSTEDCEESMQAPYGCERGLSGAGRGRHLCVTRKFKKTLGNTETFGIAS